MSYLARALPRLNALKEARETGVLNEGLCGKLKAHVMEVPDLEGLIEQLRQLHSLVPDAITSQEYSIHAGVAVAEAIQNVDGGTASAPSASEQAEPAAAAAEPSPAAEASPVSPAAPAVTQSTELRTEGNALYRSAKNDTSLPRVVRLTRFERAIACYAKAATDVPEATLEEQASARKNQAVALRDAAQLVNTHFEHEKEVVRLSHFLSSALHASTTALHLGYSTQKTAQWCEVLDGVKEDVYELCQKLFLDEEYGGSSELMYEDAKALHAALRELSKSELNWSQEGAAAVSYVSGHVAACLGSAVFFEAVSLLDDADDYAEALSLTVECGQYLRQAESEASRAEYDDPDLSDGLVPLSEAVGDLLVRGDRQECMSRSVQAREVADTLLREHLSEQMPDFDYLWSVADMYKSAILATRGHDVENEAIALSRLGTLYANVMSLKELALRCSSQAVELGQSLLPKDVSNEKWFKDAEDTLRKCIRLGAVSVTVNNVCTADEEAKIREDLKADIEAIKGFATDNNCGNMDRIRNLMKHLYEKHPPKNTAHTAPTDTSDEVLKRAQLVCVMHYHCDKQMRHKDLPEDSWGDGRTFKHWFILCKEITSHLSSLHTSTFSAC